MSENLQILIPVTLKGKGIKELGVETWGQSSGFDTGEILKSAGQEKKGFLKKNLEKF